ncbi:unnamed protein product [Malus baccata var. baccata]
MQRLLALKLATSNLPKNLSTTAATTSPIFHSQRHKTFSLAKPPQNHFFSSSPTHPPHHIPHPWWSQHTLAQKNSWVYLQPITQKSILSRRSWFGRVSGEQVVSRLIVANVAVFLLWRIAGHSFMINNFTIWLHKFANGYIHTLITSAFSHIDAGHMFFNMVGLYFFGMNIGIVFRPEVLLKLYLAGAVGGSVFFLVQKTLLAASLQICSFQGQQPSNTHPAKVSGLYNFPNKSVFDRAPGGAVNAIMLLDIFLFPRFTLLGIFLIGKDYLAIRRGDRHISGAAHLRGAAVAAVAWAQIRKGRLRF